MGNESNFSIRTITAGIELQKLPDLKKIKGIISSLYQIRGKYEERGYTVQTIRIATNHLHGFTGQLPRGELVKHLEEIDALTHEGSIFFSVGELASGDSYDKTKVQLASEIITNTKNINFSVRVSEVNKGIYWHGIKLAAEVIKEISDVGKGGEGNFRFAAAANCPAGIPFFPVAYHHGKPAFALGIESPNVILDAIDGNDWETNHFRIKKVLNGTLKPLEEIGVNLGDKMGLVYGGVDTSTAPGLSASIGEVIEKLTGQPFGSASTLSACSFVTDIIKSLDVKTCGYSGLMLPVLEDKVLAKRATQDYFSVQELLMYSAVSGIGLDVVPLPGDTSVDQLKRLLMDVAALSVKYFSKPMSARLFLIPGKRAGDMVSFQNPYLTDCRVMTLD